MREIRPSGSVEGVVSNHDPYSDCLFASELLFPLLLPIENTSPDRGRRCSRPYPGPIFLATSTKTANSNYEPKPKITN